MARCDPRRAAGAAPQPGALAAHVGLMDHWMCIRNRIARRAGGCKLLMIFPAATTRNSDTAIAFGTASVCPGLAAGPGSVPDGGHDCEAENRSWLRVPVPARPKNGTLPNSPTAL